MANTRISDLAVGSAIASTDRFVAVETTGVGPVTKTGTQLQQLVKSNIIGVNFITDFGAVGNGSTDNVAAMNAFNTYAMAESAAGRGVVLHVPSGTYNFNGANNQGWLRGIRKLHLIGYGAIFQNTYNRAVSGDNFGSELPWANASAPQLINGYLINTSAVGATSVTLQTAGDASHFAVNDWVVVCSFDIQFYGSPPNPDHFDFVKVVSKSGSTISFASTLRYEHRSDYPDGISSGIGKARIFPLNLFHDTGLSGNIWDVDHTYEGIEIRLAPNVSFTYFSAIGRHLRFINCILPGISPSVAKTVEVRGGRITAHSEPDKMVELCLFDNVEIEGGLLFQSSSIDRMTIRGGSISGGFLAGAKSAYLENVDIEYIGDGTVFGLNRNTVYNSCIIRSVPFPISPWRLGIAIDGTNVVYSNGVISILKSDPDVYNNIPVVGSWINLHFRGTGSNDYYAGPIGSGLVTRVYDDSTHLFIETTFQFASLPSWANGNMQVQRGGELKFLNCIGSDIARQYSAATDAGMQPWDYTKFTLAGLIGQNYNLGSAAGYLRKVRFKVLQAPNPATGTGLTITITAWDAALTTTSTLTIWFDLTNTAVREWDQIALNGAAATDGVWINTTPQTKMPNVILNGGIFGQLTYAPSGFALTSAPVLELELFQDLGPGRSIITVSKDGSGANLVATTGSLP